MHSRWWFVRRVGWTVDLREPAGNGRKSNTMRQHVTNRRRLLRMSMRAFVACGLVALVIVFLLAQRKPAWYAPVRIDLDELPGLRRDVTRNLDDISRKIASGKPFVMSWSEKELTRRLAALRDIWPESRSTWPREFSDPVVKIQADSIRIGALYESSGWRAIVSLQFAVDVPGNHDPSSSAGEEGKRPKIRVRLIEAAAGSLAAPRWLLRRWATPYLDRVARFGGTSTGNSGIHSDPYSDGSASRAEEYETRRIGLTVGQLFEGVLVDNDFIWPNGKRHFHIAKITTDSGTITLTINPQ